jgi:hypothetical protein
VHFLLLGAALFVVFSLVSGDDRPRDDEIIVSAGKIEHLAVLFERTWQRPPTRQELEGLVEDHVREEAGYREGLAIGLDQDDTIIRRRIRQKLDFIAEDLASQVEPTEAQLAAYLAAHPDDFRVDCRLSFRHVYLNPETRGDALDADARELLLTLNGDATVDASTVGDRILLEHGYAAVSTREITGLFGDAFATAIEGLAPGAWHGPIASGYGVHLVRVDARTEGRLPELAEVRDAVRREWNNARRKELTDAFYREMLERYTVIIEWPEPAAGGEGS